MAFESTHQIVYGRLGRAHQRQGLFSGDAAIHHPHAVALAVLTFDHCQEVLAGLLVEGIFGEDLVGQGNTVRGDDQGR